MKNPQLFILGILFFIIVAVCCLFYFKKQKKDDLAKSYNVTRPTLRKWAKYFPLDIPFEKWDKKRIFTPEEVSGMRRKWGYDTKLVLNKKQIVNMAESNYRTVSENVKKNLDKIGLTLEAWQKCSVFPPTVSARILEVLG